MTMTVEMLERVLMSEVENLHLRVDMVTESVALINDRLDRIDRHLQLIWNVLDNLPNIFVTKQEAERFATKEDLKNFVTKQHLSQELEKFATKDDLQKVMNLLQKVAHKVGV